MRKLLIAALVLALVLGVTGSSLAQVGLALGARSHVPLKDIPNTDFDKNHLSLLGGLRCKAAWFIVDADIDYRPKMGDVTYSLTPKVSFLVDILGSGFYAGAGIEKTYVEWASEKSEWSDLYYVLQVGVEIGGGSPSLILDTYYDSPTFSLKDIETEFITFGARLLWYL